MPLADVYVFRAPRVGHVYAGVSLWVSSLFYPWRGVGRNSSMMSVVSDCFLTFYAVPQFPTAAESIQLEASQFEKLA